MFIVKIKYKTNYGLELKKYIANRFKGNRAISKDFLCAKRYKSIAGAKRSISSFKGLDITAYTIEPEQSIYAKYISMF